MSNKRKIEIFSAGCPACVDAIEIVNRVACDSCETEVWTCTSTKWRREPSNWVSAGSRR